MLIVLEGIAPFAPSLFRRPRWQQTEGLRCGVEEGRVVRVKLEVVVRCQEGNAEDDESPSTDEERPRSASGDGPEELRFVEVRSLHGAIVQPAWRPGGS